MTACQSIYHELRRIAISIASATCLIAAAGCSNSTKSAMEQGAVAQAQFEAGQLAEARETITDAVQIRDDIPELQLLRGRIELAANAPANAFRAYNNALSLDSANGEALLGVAQLGLQTGNLRASENAADRLLTLDPRQQTALVIKGLHNLVKRRYDAALANADLILASSPTNEAAAVLKSRALAMLDRSDEAFAILEKARAGSGDTRGIANALLELHRQRGDGPAMLAELERLRAFKTGDHAFDIDEADTLYKLGEARRARVVLQQALLDPALDDDTATALARLWREYDPTPLDQAALDQFAQKAGLPARKAVARFFIERNELDRATAALRGAPAADDVTALRARIAIAQGNLDKGLQQAAAILARDQTHCEALVAKAQAFNARKRTSDAIIASQTAISNCPRFIPAYLALARAHETDGAKQGVSIAFRDAFDRNNQDSGLARIYTAWLEQAGEGTRAVAIARRLTNNAPALLSGWRLYLELCAKFSDARCTSEAEAGLATARRLFGVDQRTGEPPPTGLFGRLNRK